MENKYGLPAMYNTNGISSCYSKARVEYGINEVEISEAHPFYFLYKSKGTGGKDEN